MAKRQDRARQGECEAFGSRAPRRAFADKRIAVLLATYNGARFLERQIGTLARQTAGTIDIWASDDGSTDGSRAVLEKTAGLWQRGEFHILDGPGCGYAENFRSLMTNPQIEADYVAFCDQDDEWDEDKLEEALSWLCRQEAPALYCSRTRIITSRGETTGLSPLFPRPPDFRNAIVQSIAGANTMVMNRAAWQVVREASRRTSFVSHDWWCYIMVSGVGGVVHYSPQPKIGYRQHDGNQIGENSSWRARMSRISHLMRGRFMDWNTRNLAALEACGDMLSPSARKTAALFAEARTGRLVGRLGALRRSGVYRQTVLGQIGLLAACILRKL
ncbi:glycosyltransferase family 2 protein [Chelativorans intermedius]|uniref:Glycosyltransferase family 2 protein n=1 Tax=Chelativorans intermedius TaxID=515947 RepID=A0ABV6D2A3_9HYPH|nr:glycosyltransferase family 2 protein [Chelativorans intermedius]MCT8997407.1 glycosyltransferase family 2 protein [Chelativorans intermedius]